MRVCKCTAMQSYYMRVSRKKLTLSKADVRCCGRVALGIEAGGTLIKYIRARMLAAGSPRNPPNKFEANNPNKKPTSNRRANQITNKAYSQSVGPYLTHTYTILYKDTTCNRTIDYTRSRTRAVSKNA